MVRFNPLPRKTQVTIIAALAIAALAACGGGGSGGLREVPAPAPSSSAGGAVAQASISVPATETGVPIPLPTLPGITGTVTLPANNAAPGTSITVTTSATLPSFVNGAPESGSVIFLAITLSSADNVTFQPGGPKFVVTLSQPPVNHGAYFAWMYDSINAWKNFAALNVSGNTLTFGDESTQLSLEANVPVAIVALTATAGSGCPTPTPGPTPTPTVTASPFPTSSPTADPQAATFYRSVRNTSDRNNVRTRLDVFKDGLYQTPDYSIADFGSSNCMAVNPATAALFVCRSDRVDIYARDATTPTESIALPSAAFAVAFDGVGNAYVDIGTEIREYSSGDFTTAVRTIAAPSGFHFAHNPSMLAVNRTNGNLYVLVSNATGNGTFNGWTVDVYGPSDTAPSLRIPYPDGNFGVGLDAPGSALALDSTGELYVSGTESGCSGCGPGVNVLGYPSGSATPDVVLPSATTVAVDSSDNVFVYRTNLFDSACAPFFLTGTLEEYAPRSSTLIASARLTCSGFGPEKPVMYIDKGGTAYVSIVVWSGPVSNVTVNDGVLIFPSIARPPFASLLSEQDNEFVDSFTAGP